MDAATQRLLERTRERREILTKKLAETSPSRKRSSPLAPIHNDNLKLTDQGHDDTPHKRHCMRDDEQNIKPDTPAIQGVRSRMQNLVAQRTNWGDKGEQDAMDTAAPVPVRPISPDLEPAKPRASTSSRRNRLAALASTINNWEDDLSHPNFKPEEPPKKVWQRPKPVEAPSVDIQAPSKPSRQYNVAKNDIEVGPPKPPRFNTEKVQKEEPESKLSEKELTIEKSPLKKQSARFVSPARSPSKITSNAVEDKIVSSVSVHLSRAEDKKVAAFSASLSKTEDKKVSVYSSKTDIRNETSKTHTPYKPTFKPQLSPMKTPRASDANEPTKQPVSARLAQWQKKTAAADAGKNSDPTSTPVSARMASWQQKVNVETKTPGKTPGKTPLRTEAPKTTAQISSSAVKKVPVTRSPAKSPAKSPGKFTSPSKVGQATQSIHERLTNLSSSWQNNEIAEKIKKQKEIDMAALQNRWKNGLLSEESQGLAKSTDQSSDNSHSNQETVDTSIAKIAQPEVGPGVPPPAPPPPAVGSPVKKSPLKKNVSGSVVYSSPTKKAVSSSRPPMKKNREEVRDRLRSDGEQEDMTEVQAENEEHPNHDDSQFENKLEAMGFEISAKQKTNVASFDLKSKKGKEQEKTVTVAVNNTTAKSPIKAAGSPLSKFASPNNPAPPPARGSIYNLIKKQTPSFASPAGATPGYPTTPDVMMRARAAPSHGNDVMDDSFESQDSFESNRESVTEVEQTEDDVDSTCSPQESFASTQSEYSETEDTSQTEDYTSETTDYTADDITQSEGEESCDDLDEEGGEINDLLDEAMDTTETESEAGYPVYKAPMAAPRRKGSNAGRQQPRPRSYFGEENVASSEFRKPDSRAAGDIRRHAESKGRAGQQLDKRVTWASGVASSTEASETESESEKRELVYSIDLYRSTGNKKNAPVPKMTIVRHTEHQRREPEDALPYIPAKCVKQRLQELQESVSQEQSVIMQTSNALNQCCGTNSSFAGSAQAVECHRILLTACKKREVYLEEMQHLKEGRDTKPSGPQGSLTISDIRLPLKQDFMSRIGTPEGFTPYSPVKGPDNSVHYFLILIRHGTHIVFTQMVCSHENLTRGSLDIPNLIKLSDIGQGFRIDLEVYGMSVTREAESGQSGKKKKGQTPKKKFFSLRGSSHLSSLQSPGGPTAVRSTNFVCVATMPITIKSLNKTHFTLERVPYSSPLQGTIHLQLRCVMESNVEERGFLTMFEDVSGFGAWHRRWCVLKNNFLSYWMYPDCEYTREAMGFIDLKNCITDTVGLIPRDVCARPNSFELCTVRRQLRGEKETLVSKCYNTMTTTKHWISADTREDRMAWSNKLNEALHNIRTWHPDAFRPIKKN